MRLKRAQEIRRAWENFDDGDMSTERLAQMVADFCRCQYEDVFDALQMTHATKEQG